MVIRAHKILPVSIDESLEKNDEYLEIIGRNGLGAASADPPSVQRAGFAGYAHRELARIVDVIGIDPERRLGP